MQEDRSKGVTAEYLLASAVHAAAKSKVIYSSSSSSSFISNTDIGKTERQEKAGKNKVILR